MTDNDLKARLDIVQKTLQGKEPRLSLEEAAEYMRIIGEAATTHRFKVFDSVKDEVEFLIQETEKDFVRKSLH